MLTRTLQRYFSQTHKHINPPEMIAKMHDLRTHIQHQQQELALLQKQVNDKEIETSRRNKAIHEKRIKLTEDFRKAEQLWADAKKKSEANKSAAILDFAANLIPLAIHFHHAKSLENDQHSTDLREGFDNTVRLFFSTLDKFKIKQTDLKPAATYKKEEVTIVGQEKGELKDSIAKVVEQGWLVQGKLIVKPKVIIYN